MYIIDKLKTLQVNGNTIDSVLANYFLSNIGSLNRISFHECLEKTNVSKASVNRFYRKAGFANYRNFVGELAGEYQALVEAMAWNQTADESAAPDWKIEESNIIEDFIADLTGCTKVVFYGESNQISLLAGLKKLLLMRGIPVFELNSWDKDTNEKVVAGLADRDIFVVVDINYELPFLIEMSIHQLDAINLNHLNMIELKKYFFGKAKHHRFKTFKTLRLGDHNEKAVNRHLLISLDELLVERMRAIP